MFGVYDEASGLALRDTFIFDPEGTRFPTTPMCERAFTARRGTKGKPGRPRDRARIGVFQSHVRATRWR
jgi:hypothetical protein